MLIYRNNAIFAVWYYGSSEWGNRKTINQSIWSDLSSKHILHFKYNIALQYLVVNSQPLPQRPVVVVPVSRAAVNCSTIFARGFMLQAIQSCTKDIGSGHVRL